MMKRLPISVCMISGPEEARIGCALRSVTDWVAEIVIVLNQEVRDRTEDIARREGAVVFREPWKGHIAQKNSAAEKATQPWLLGLDADEAISVKLRSEIAALFERGNLPDAWAACSIPRCTFYCGRWIRHGDWYPDRQTRLWRKGRARWHGIDPHDKLEVQGPVRKLKSDLFHFSNDSINAQVTKLVPFSDAFVRHRMETRRGAGWFDLAVRPGWRFLRAYFFKLGFLDGWQGYYIAWLAAFSAVTRYAKTREAEALRGTSQKDAPGDEP